MESNPESGESSVTVEELPPSELGTKVQVSVGSTSGSFYYELVHFC